jgi:hypothetical protein
MRVADGREAAELLYVHVPHAIRCGAFIVHGERWCGEGSSGTVRNTLCSGLLPTGLCAAQSRARSFLHAAKRGALHVSLAGSAWNYAVTVP